MNIIGGNAAGIAGNVGGKSYIEYCDNYGAITGTSSAAGILANTSASKDSVKVVTGEGENAVTTYELRFNDCVNAGHILSAENTKAAGISGSSNNMGQYNYCRNYGKVECTNNAGTVCGITCDNASDPEAVMAITNCLEASGLNENNNGTPIVTEYAHNDSFIRNFYVYGDCADKENGNSIPAGSLAKQNYNNMVLSTLENDYLGYINSNYSADPKKVVEDIKNMANSNSPDAAFLQSLYVEIQGNHGYNGNKWLKEDSNINAFLRKALAVYLAMNVDHTDYSGWTGLWNNREDTELQNYIIVLKYIFNNGTAPDSMATATAGQNGNGAVPDDSHWPVQLYAYHESDNSYTLTYRRLTHYFDSGINGLNDNPLNHTSWDACLQDLDRKFIAMTNDTANHPNGDSSDGTNVYCGFVGNVYNYAATQSNPNPAPAPAPAPPNDNSGNDTSNDQNQGTDNNNNNNSINNQTGNDTNNQQPGTDTNQTNTTGTDQNQSGTDNNSNGTNTGNDQNQSTDNNANNNNINNQTGNDANNQQSGTDTNQTNTTGTDQNQSTDNNANNNSINNQTGNDANNQQPGTDTNQTNTTGTDQNQGGTDNNPSQDPASIPSNDPASGNDGNDEENNGN